jgi:hypothetical protein
MTDRPTRETPLTLETAVRVAGEVRHGVNNSLMGIMGQLEVLGRRPGLPPEARAQVDALMELARRIRDQVAALNDLRLS